MNIKLGYGTGFLEATVADKNVIKVLSPNQADFDREDNPKSTYDIVMDSLNNPVGSPHILNIVKPGEKIVIITSDITRPLPSRDVLPPLLDTLERGGISCDDITILFALGSHRPHTEEEMRYLVGNEIYEKIRCVDSNPDDCLHLGETRQGTPIDITRVVAQADRRICLGNIEYHYFAGYSGGIKALMPGASTPAAIQTNHSMMTSSDACAGKLEGNPVREDLEEAEKFCPIDYIVNVVLDENKNIKYSVSGHIKKAHRKGCAFLDSMYQVEIPRRADIVVVSQGGAPKDLNLYQTQKALDNAKHAVKKGGTIILAGSCKEGLGQKVFQEWITTAKSPEELISRIQENFTLGGHKAAAIAMVMKNASIKLISEMDPNFVSSMFFQPYGDLQSAIDDALREQGEDASIIIMPYGGSTLPVERP